MLQATAGLRCGFKSNTIGPPCLSTVVRRRRRVVTFRDPQLQQHYERAVSVVKGCLPDQLPICALLDAWHWFHLIEGDESPRAKEAIEHLLSPELRSGLRGWYHRWGAGMNPAATEFRDRLGEMAGERFG